MTDDDFYKFIFTVTLVVCMVFVGYRVGADSRQADLLTDYCQSAEYVDYIEIDDMYYCYDGDKLEAIEWMNGASQ